MIAGKKLLFVARRKLTPSSEDCKNDMAEFCPAVPADPGEVGGCAVFGVHSVL